MSKMAQTIVAKGIGWVNESAYGSVLSSQHVRYEDGAAEPPWKQKALFQAPLKNAGRFDLSTRLIISACALALQEADVAWGNGVKSNIGLLGANSCGCVAANHVYFKDYLEGGRALARANLFVYTLPSSPLAEVAIHFGLQGPVLYIGFSGSRNEQLLGLIETGAGLLHEGSVDGMLLVANDERFALAVFIGNGTGGRREFTQDDLMARLKRGDILNEGKNQ